MIQRVETYVGIDPGLSGAIAMVTTAGVAQVWSTPTFVLKGGRKKRRIYAAAEMVRILREIGSARVVGLELVRAMPKQGVVSMFSMGHGVGLWEGIITALGLPLEQVTPQVWKREMLGGVTGSDKSASIAKALALFPAMAAMLAHKKDDGRAEALLIAEYFRRRLEGAKRRGR